MTGPSQQMSSAEQSSPDLVPSQSEPGDADRGRNHNRAEEQARGRSAEKPSDIPAPGWKDIILRVYGNIGKNRVIVVAAGVTFYCLLAVFPAIAALVAIYGLFTDPASLSSHLESVSDLLPGGAVDVIRDQMTRIASHGASTLGLTFFVGLAVSLWSANAGVKSIFDALNLVYNEEEKRGFIKLNLVSLAFTAGAIVLLIFAITGLVALPLGLNYLGLGEISEWLVTLGRWPVLFAAIAFALAILYRYGPSRSEPKWRWISWGSGLAALSWIVMSILFSWYAANFGSYNATYGSLGAAIGFMMWLWLSTIIVLLGAEINAEMEHQTARDTTTGNRKPLGARHAVMADTVGASRR